MSREVLPPLPHNERTSHLNPDQNMDIEARHQRLRLSFEQHEQRQHRHLQRLQDATNRNGALVDELVGLVTNVRNVMDLWEQITEQGERPAREVVAEEQLPTGAASVTDDDEHPYVASPMTARARVEQLERELERVLECSICLSFRDVMVQCCGCHSFVACLRCAVRMTTTEGARTSCPKCRHAWSYLGDRRTNNLVRNMATLSQMLRHKPLLVDDEPPSQ